MNTITFGVKNSLYIFGGYIKMQSKAFYIYPQNACFSHRQTISITFPTTPKGG